MNVNQNVNGDSPLRLAIQHNAGAAVGLLVFYGASDPEGNAKKLLRSSIQLGSFAAVQATSDINATDSDYGRTALHWATWRGSRLELELLQKKNAKDNRGDNDGMTALHIACAGGHDSTIQLLVDRFAADGNATTSDGKTPLHLACERGHDSTIQLLVGQYEADTEAKTNDGTTPLHIACAGGHGSTVRLLIENFGADVKARSQTGQTALHLLLKKLYVSQVLEFHQTTHR